MVQQQSIPLEIRKVNPEDAAELLAIYAPYVEHTAITFEYDVPTVEEFRHRIENVTRSYPWLVAVADGRIVGYSYAGPFKERAAYQWAVETSIYVAMGEKHRGIGRMLVAALEEALRQQGILNVNACIAYTEKADEHLPPDSVFFHERLGYAKVAHFHKCGRKFGKWYDMIWMEKMIGEHR